MKNKNLIYLLAGGVAVYFIYRAMSKKDSSESNFLNITGRMTKSDPCGCYGAAGTSSRGTLDQTLADGTAICTNSFGYTYACSPKGAQTSLLSL
jgi:hypothetical protein